jgi:hypothetical protein
MCAKAKYSLAKEPISTHAKPATQTLDTKEADFQSIVKDNASI